MGEWLCIKYGSIKFCESQICANISGQVISFQTSVFLCEHLLSSIQEKIQQLYLSTMHVVVVKSELKFRYFKKAMTF